MRLQTKEIQAILAVAKEIYGESVEVYLFGSRLDDNKRGGDIDLLVRTNGEKRGILSRIRMTSRIKDILGDRKIDIIGDYEDSVVAQKLTRKEFCWHDTKETRNIGTAPTRNPCLTVTSWQCSMSCFLRQIS